jgi:signal peptidase II
VDAPAPSPPVAITPAAPPAVSWARWFIPAAVATLVLDLLSKWVIFAQAEASLPGWLKHHYNTGVAWSVLGDHPWFVTGLTLVLIPFLAWLWWAQYRRAGWAENFAFGLILGGALGNGFDRVAARLGCWPGVRDFLYVDLPGVPFCSPFPTFNVADSGITIGFAVLVLRALFPARPAAT